MSCVTQLLAHGWARVQDPGAAGALVGHPLECRPGSTGPGSPAFRSSGSDATSGVPTGRNWSVRYGHEVNYASHALRPAYQELGTVRDGDSP
jgi:hypothetical protein